MRAGADLNADDRWNSSDLDDLRPRSDDEPSEDEPEVTAERVPTTAFSVPVKRAIEQDGSNCWHCSSDDKLEHIHLLGKTMGPTLNRLQSQGRTNLAHLHQAENGMYLCNRCHGAMDNIEDPGWVFVPANLDFFLEAEHTDYQRRLAIFRNSRGTNFPPRVPPSPERYIQTCGGLYTRYMLRRYGSPFDAWQQRGLSAYPPNPKVWHGDPMLALFKALSALGRNLLVLPGALLTLGRLYESNDSPPELGDPTQYQLTDEDGNDDDNSEADRNASSPPLAPDTNLTVNTTRGGRGRGRGQGRGRGRGRGRGKRGDQSDVPLPAEACGQQPGSRYNLRTPSARQSVGRGQRRGRGGVSRPRGRVGGLAKLDDIMNDDEWEAFIRQLEESRKLAARNGHKVEISPFKWGPQQSSSMQAQEFRRYTSEMEARGFNMSWDTGKAESSHEAHHEVKKARNNKMQDGKNPVDVSGLLSPPNTEERVLQGVDRKGVRKWLATTGFPNTDPEQA